MRYFFIITLFFMSIFAQNLDEFEKEYKQKEQISDPLYGYNKFMTDFNVGFYKYFARPIVTGYNNITPKVFRESVANVFDNTLMPLRLGTNLLQFKFKESLSELKRFSINIIFGFFGIIDAASKTDIKKYPSDFGTTLAHWGVGGGFYLVLPILGPSNLRDTITMPLNWYLSPTSYIDPTWASISIDVYGSMNKIALEKEKIDEIYKNTPNLYIFLRDSYESSREKLSE